MTNGEIIEQLENTIGLIKQDGKDWLDDRDIPILEACIKSLTALNKIRADIWDLQYGDEEKSMTDEDRADAYNNAIRQVIEIIDMHKAEIKSQENEDKG